MMELLQKEHQRLWKSAQSSKSADDAQSIINLLKEARDNIENGRSKSSNRPALSTHVHRSLVVLILMLTYHYHGCRPKFRFDHPCETAESGESGL